MPPNRTPEQESFIHAVYAAVQEIPHGKVTTYGHIAMLIGTPQRPRQVGQTLKALPSSPTHRFNSSTVPWQRVINAKGEISPRGPGGAARQAEELESEGVRVERDAMGIYAVDLGGYGWFPEFLPSEEREEEYDFESADEEGGEGEGFGEGDDGEVEDNVREGREVSVLGGRVKTTRRAGGEDEDEEEKGEGEGDVDWGEVIARDEMEGTKTTRKAA